MELLNDGFRSGVSSLNFAGTWTLQLGCKSVKYITRLTVANNVKPFGRGLGSASTEGDFAWYAGI